MLLSREVIYILGRDVNAFTFPETASRANTVYYLPGLRALITGDLVTSLTTPILYHGNIERWITQLRELLARFPGMRTIHPGHGEPGPAKFLITEQMNYLTFFRGQIEKALDDDGKVTEGERRAIVKAVEDRFPTYRTSGGFKKRADLIRRNIDWVLASWKVKGVEAPKLADLEAETSKK